MTVVAVGTLSWINDLSNHQFNCGTFLLFVESTNIRIRQIKTIKPSNVLLLSWRGRSFWRFSSSLYSSHLSYSYHSTTKEMAGAPYDTRRGLKKYRSFLPSFLSPFVLSTVQCTALQCFSVSECNISRVESRGERLAHATEPHPTFSGVVIVCYCPILFAVSTILCFLPFFHFFFRVELSCENEKSRAVDWHSLGNCKQRRILFLSFCRSDNRKTSFPFSLVLNDSN